MNIQNSVEFPGVVTPYTAINHIHGKTFTTKACSNSGKKWRLQVRVCDAKKAVYHLGRGRTMYLWEIHKFWRK